MGNKRVPLLLMVLLMFSTQAATDIFLSGLPLMATDFGTSMSETNLTISVFWYAQALFVLLIGVVSDLRGRRATVLTCLILHILASGVIAMTTSMPIVLIMRVFQALGGAAIYIVFRLIIKDVMNQKEQIRAVGLLVMGMVLSPILAPIVGAWLIEYSGWRACFWMIAGVEIPLFVWALKVLKETNHRQQELRNRFCFKEYVFNYYSVLRSRYFIFSSLIVGSTFGAFYGFISISSWLYIEQCGVSPSHYSYVFIGIALAFLLGNRIMSTMNERDVHPKQIVKWGIYVAAVGSIIILGELVFQTSALVVITLISVGTCLLRASNALINPPMQVMVMNHFPLKGAYALGLLTSIQYIFAALATSLVSNLPLRPSYSFATVTTLFVAFSILGYLFYSKHKK